MYKQILSLVTSFFKSMKGNLMFSFLLSRRNGKRGSKRRLSPEQIVALNIYRFHFRIGDLKNYHKMVKELMHDKVPELTNYENFLKATNKSAILILSFMNFLMRLNKMSGLKCYHIKYRSIIESDWGTLKNNFSLEYHKARCTTGMFRHFFYSIVAYMLNRNLNYYDNFFRPQLA